MLFCCPCHTCALDGCKQNFNLLGCRSKHTALTPPNTSPICSKKETLEHAYLLCSRLQPLPSCTSPCTCSSLHSPSMAPPNPKTSSSAFSGSRLRWPFIRPGRTKLGGGVVSSLKQLCSCDTVALYVKTSPQSQMRLFLVVYRWQLWQGG